MEIIVGGIIEKDNKILMVKEAKKKCYGKWNVPAGHLEDGETIFEGAIREIFEETGCKVRLKNVLPIINKELENVTFLLITFTTELLEENISFNKEEIFVSDRKERFICLKSYSFWKSTKTAPKSRFCILSKLVLFWSGWVFRRFACFRIDLFAVARILILRPLQIEHDNEQYHDKAVRHHNKRVVPIGGHETARDRAGNRAHLLGSVT